MNPMMMELLPLVHQGYCCSQLLLLLMLQAQDRQNPGVVRAAQGLCHGIGQSDGPCGLLTGGACALALAAGAAPLHGQPDRQRAQIRQQRPLAYR